MFPTIIWESDLAVKDNNFLLKMKNYSIKNRNSDPKGIDRSNFGGWHSNLFKNYPNEFSVFENSLEQILQNIKENINIPTLKLS